MSGRNRIEDVEGILRTMSNESVDSIKSEISVTSDVASNRLQEGLDQLPKTTIELKKTPQSIFIPVEFFKCKLCHDSKFQRFSDLISHQIDTHPNVTIENEETPVELFNHVKKFSCPICKFHFKSAYSLGNHIQAKICEAARTKSNKSKIEFYTREEDGTYRCQQFTCEYKCKSRPVMSKHVKYAHFQHMDCFVSRNNDLRQAALDLQEQTRMQHKKGRQEREEKRLLNQEKKRIREENRKRKQQLNDEKIHTAEKMAKIEKQNGPSSSTMTSNSSASSSRSPSKIFDQSVTNELARNLLNRTDLRLPTPNSFSSFYPGQNGLSRWSDQLLFPLNRFHAPIQFQRPVQTTADLDAVF